LTNFTNDAWFAGSSAEERHFFIGAMRGLENGRYFIQEASVGISGVVGPNGDVLRSVNALQSNSFAIKAQRIQRKTLFTRLGLWRFPVFVLLTGFMLVLSIRRSGLSGASE